MTKTSATARTIQKAHNDSVRKGMEEVATYLQDLFGQKLVAHIANVKDHKRVGRWTAGEGISAGAEERLRVAYKVARIILDAGDTDEVVRAWFIGLNPQLDGVAPATSIREGDYRDVLDAVEAFISGG